MVSVTWLEGFDPMYIFKSKAEFKEWLLAHIDLTYLTPYLPESELKEFLKRALEYGFKKVCIPITSVKKAKEILSGKDLGIITFLSSFHGNRDTVNEKLSACSSAISLGADEVEFSPNLSLLQNIDDFKSESAIIIDNIRKSKKVSKLYLEIDKLPENLIENTIRTAALLNPDYLSIYIKLREEESYEGENLNISKEWFEKIYKIIKDITQINLKIYGRIDNFNNLLPIMYLSTKYNFDISKLRIGTEFGFDIIDGIDISD